MRIHTDKNGVYVNAISKTADGRDVDGHQYTITHQSTDTLNFQLGAVKEAGVNGITNESLIAILIHRIAVLNTKFPSKDNGIAIDHLVVAQQALDRRTADRIGRGVEGQGVI